MYTREYIQELYEKTGNDPALLERVIFAFGLLEAIRQVDLPFCFKGGTSLMLLLDRSMRLSTDIDIIERNLFIYIIYYFFSDFSIFLMKNNYLCTRQTK